MVDEDSGLCGSGTGHRHECPCDPCHDNLPNSINVQRFLPNGLPSLACNVQRYDASCTNTVTAGSQENPDWKEVGSAVCTVVVGSALSHAFFECLVPEPWCTCPVARPCLLRMAPMEPLVLEPLLKSICVQLTSHPTCRKAPMEPLVREPLLKAAESGPSKRVKDAPA